MSYYEILMVSNNASPEVIRAAYRTLSQKFHPDKNSGNAAATEVMAKINQAYEVLSNPEKRRVYDQELAYAADRRDASSNPRPSASPTASASESSRNTGGGVNSKRDYKYHGSAATKANGSGGVGKFMRFGFWVSIFCIWAPLAAYKPFVPGGATDVAPAKAEKAIKQGLMDDRNRQNLYDTELSRLEAKYPQINPDSQLYDRRLVADIIGRLETLSQYSDQHVALGVAVEQVMREHKLSRQSSSVPRHSQNSMFIPDPRSSKNPSAAKEGCQYKGVMTDDDYRACGLNPPKP